MKLGFLEKRQHERLPVSIKTKYQLLTEDETRRYRDNPDYVKQAEAQGGVFTRGEAKDLSEGGMALVGSDLFRAGYKVLVRFEMPDSPDEVSCVTEVRWVQQFMEAGRPMYRAGLKFLYLKKDDAGRLHQYLTSLGAQT